MENVGELRKTIVEAEDKLRAIIGDQSVGDWVRLDKKCCVNAEIYIRNSFNADRMDEVIQPNQFKSWKEVAHFFHQLQDWGDLAIDRYLFND
jgi:hypothetical protein